MSASLYAKVEAAVGRGILRFPPSVVAWLAGRPVEHGGSVLDAQLQLAMRAHDLLGHRHTHELPVAEAREVMEANCALLAPAPPLLDRVVDLRIPGPGGDLAARVYRPRGARSPAPAAVFFHGGGMVTGSLASHDAPCRVLAAESGCVVVAVDYRLAPEHRFPEPVEDAVAAFRYVAREAPRLGLDPARLAVAGDSAGGTLSAVVALETRGDAVRPRFQLLVYPAVDLTCSFPSIKSLGKGFFLEEVSMAWYIAHYLPPEQDRRDPRVSPLFAPDHRGLPPALVQTAGFDPLRDEGAAYVEALRAAGVPTEHRRYETLIHGYFNLSGGIAGARAPLADAAAALRRALA
jgi:acetyl esterase